MQRKTLALFLLVLVNSTAGALSGDLDTSFSSDGLVITNFGGLDSYVAIAQQADGRIVVAGVTDTANDDWILARYTTAGGLDSSFDGDGRRSFDVGATNDVATGVAIQTDGRIVVAGLSAGRAIVARFNSNGSLDTGFGPSGNGKAVAFPSSGNGGVSVGIDGSGRIIVAGTTTVGTDQEFIVARFTPAGVLDTAFSGDGLNTVGFGPGSADLATGMAVAADGIIVVVGIAGDIGVTGTDFALARFSASTGAFLSGARFDRFGCSDSAAAVALQPDGKIVVAGLVTSFCTGTQPVVSPVVVRFSAGSTLDTTFNGSGTRNIAFSGLDSGIPRAIAVQADGRILVAGLVKSTNQAHRTEFGLTRLNATGSADLSFSGDAMQQTSFGAGEAIATAMLLQAADGRIVAAGTFSIFNSSGALVARDGAVARLHAITCNNLNATRVGTSGANAIIGTASADVIHGMDGNDTISGGSGNDSLCGGSGDDQLLGDTGSDTLFGEVGVDNMNGGDGADICVPGSKGNPPRCDTDTFVSCETISTCASGLGGEWLRLEQHCVRAAAGPALQCVLTGALSVFNPGQESTPVPAQVSFFLSDDAVLDEGDTFLAIQKVRVIDAGESQRLPFVHRLPGATDLLGHYVIAFVDSTDVVPERNEDNNYAAGLISGAP